MVAPLAAGGCADRLLALAADLLLWGDTARGGEYLDLLEQAQPPIPPESRLAARFAAMRSFHYALTGQLNEAVDEALAARAIQEQMQLEDEWNVAVPMILMGVYNCLEDFPAVEREAAAALAMPELAEPVKLVMVPGAQALAWFEAGRLAEAAEAAGAAERAGAAAGIRPAFLRRGLPARAGRPGAGAAGPRRRRAADRAGAVDNRAAAARCSSSWRCWTGPRSGPPAGRSARRWRPSRRRGWSWPGPGRCCWRGPMSWRRCCACQLGDLRSPAELAGRLPPPAASLLLARIALAAGDHHAAQEHLQSPRRRPDAAAGLVRQILLAAAAIERGDPATAGILGGVIQIARRAASSTRSSRPHPR